MGSLRGSKPDDRCGISVPSKTRSSAAEAVRLQVGDGGDPRDNRTLHTTALALMDLNVSEQDALQTPLDLVGRSNGVTAPPELP
jgi:hypothetical protein